MDALFAHATTKPESLIVLSFLWNIYQHSYLMLMQAFTIETYIPVDGNESVHKRP